MKKIIALVLCLMMVLSLSAAVAESPVVAIEDLYEGAWVQFEEGFELYLPADWYQFEVDEETLAGGISYVCGTEDLSRSMMLGWGALNKEYTLEELHAELVVDNPEAKIAQANGIGMVLTADMENSQLVIAALDAAEPGLYTFIFSPIDDEEFVTLAALIASTIRNIQ